MKKYLRLFLINFLAIWLVADLLEGISYSDGYKTLAASALILTLINFIIKPLIKLLLLPVNLITLGSFRWLVNVLSLYLMTSLVPKLEVQSFEFVGFTQNGFVVPTANLSVFWVLVIASFVISLMTTLLLWLAK